MMGMREAAEATMSSCAGMLDKKVQYHSDIAGDLHISKVPHSACLKYHLYAKYHTVLNPITA